MRRSDKVRGPYMRPEAYDRLSELSDNEDINIGDALDEIIISVINESGNIVVNQVNAKIDWSEIDES